MRERLSWPRTYFVRRLHELVNPRKPGVVRGINCRRCGGDEWKKDRHKDKDKWRCRRCLWDYLTRSRKANPARSLWRSAKWRARSGGVPFTISVDDIKAVWPKSGTCPVFGVRLLRGQDGGSTADSPTLDRINNNWGYEIGNIAVISMKANRAKGEHSASDIMKLAKWMKKQGLK